MAALAEPQGQDVKSPASPLAPAPGMEAFKDGGFYGFGICVSHHKKGSGVRKVNFLKYEQKAGERSLSLSLTTTGTNPVFYIRTTPRTREFAPCAPFWVLGIVADEKKKGVVGLRVRFVDKTEKVYFPGDVRGGRLVNSTWLVTHDRD